MKGKHLKNILIMAAVLCSTVVAFFSVAKAYNSANGADEYTIRQCNLCHGARADSGFNNRSSYQSAGDIISYYFLYHSNGANGANGCDGECAEDVNIYIWAELWGNCTDLDADDYFVEDTCGTEVDCDDNATLVNPGAAENPGDGIDNNCDGTIDEQNTGASSDPTTSGGGVTGEIEDTGCFISALK